LNEDEAFERGLIQEIGYIKLLEEKFPRAASLLEEAPVEMRISNPIFSFSKEKEKIWCLSVLTKRHHLYFFVGEETDKERWKEFKEGISDDSVIFMEDDGITNLVSLVKGELLGWKTLAWLAKYEGS